MAKVSIYIDESYINQEGCSALYLRTYIGGSYVRIPLNIHVSLVNFNKDNFRISGKKTKELNLIINESLGRAADIILKYQVNKIVLTKDLFIQEYSNPAYFVDFFEYMEKSIHSRRNEIAETTTEQHLVQLRKLKRFRKTLLMPEIDEKFLKNYENWLLRKEKNSINTTHNALKTLKTYILRAKREKLITNNPFEFFKIKKEKTYPVFLTLDERQALIELYDSDRLKRKLQKTLRWFLFSCYTGLRISDLRTVEHEFIKNKVLIFRPIKTINTSNRKIYLPLHTKALQLIKDENKFRIKGLLFDCDSEQKMNKNIKEIIFLAKIRKHVSFHTARHTFATSMLKSMKRADGILILKELLGHENIASTMVYTHIIDDDLQAAINDFD